MLDECRDPGKEEQAPAVALLHNFDGKDLEYPTNVPKAKVLSVIPTGRRSKAIMSIIGEATQALGPLSIIITMGGIMKSVAGRVPIFAPLPL